ncbi:aminoglycoside phosphotransferase family protein [Frankia sp. QA3]|uniref:aminoglycoside phosphotransferase family protein n=1 Tax=Frankia sp. QA3 TaxID=710111 RepID=UPI000269C2EF|nr:aminoglycoside phosphotransferase family protein [Frankia sp. QA3]EIV91169.1 streptomycin 6-kinase [Frankia sp. QA3]
MTSAREGPAGQRWIDRLPSLIDDLLTDWGLQHVGEPMHGLVGLVLPVREDTGEERVLKISWPDEETRHEPTGLRAWAGRGAVLLLAVDNTRNAMLLERLDATTTLQHQPIIEAIDAAASVLRQLHIQAPAGLPTTTETAERWHTALAREWRRLGKPGPAHLIDAATLTCNDLAHETEQAALLHGDFHFANVLAGSRQRWNAIDPQPLSGDREYDLLPLLRNRWPEIVAGQGASRGVRYRLDALSEAAGLDRAKARRWSFVRSVDDALWGHAHHNVQFEAIAWEIAQALSS